MAPQTWLIQPENEGERLDLFLTTILPERTRSNIQKLIQDGRITVNGGEASVHRFLKNGDKIVWDGQERTPKPKVSVKKEIGPLPDLRDLIVEETPDYLVIDKPAGLMVHPDSEQKEGTLVDLLVAHDPHIAKVGEDPERPGIVHRLDREVSGLMVIAKTHDAYEALKKQFASRTVKKTYLAFCHGSLPEEEGDIKFRIARSTTQPRMAARPVKENEGKAAWTHYHVRERFKGATLADVEILSGRTHQIRAHLHAMQCPVIGDQLYSIERTQRNIKAPRLMLQSVSLEFDDPTTGERKKYELAPDPAFDALAEEFRVS
ncbi:MAG TPA: RluA family pseudouridine synthase [Verrucomicrobiae bacterium]|nr:RluA family pseudouridine synthase [Verrucomicrobiae bacterium]